MKAERLAEIRAWVEEQKAFDLPLEPYGLASPWHEQAFAIIDDLLAEIARLTTIDDAMVERAAKAFFESEGGAAWEHVYADEAAECRQKARLVIEAALGKHPRDAQEGTK